MCDGLVEVSAGQLALKIFIDQNDYAGGDAPASSQGRFLAISSETSRSPLLVCGLGSISRITVSLTGASHTRDTWIGGSMPNHSGFARSI